MRGSATVVDNDEPDEMLEYSVESLGREMEDCLKYIPLLDPYVTNTRMSGLDTFAFGPRTFFHMERTFCIPETSVVEKTPLEFVSPLKTVANPPPYDFGLRIMPWTDAFFTGFPISLTT